MLKGHTNYELKKSLTSMEFRVTAQGIKRDFESLTSMQLDPEVLKNTVWLDGLAHVIERTYHWYLRDFGTDNGSEVEPPVDVPGVFLRPNAGLAVAKAIDVPVSNTEYQDAEVTQVPVYAAPVLSDEAKATLAASRNAFLFGYEIGMESIHELYNKVRAHPDFRGGVIFTSEDTKTGFADESRMAELGWDLIYATQDDDEEEEDAGV